MDINLIHRYIEDACQAYQACLAGLGMTASASDLSALLRAARRREIDRRGEVTSPQGGGYEYHIHGGGYSFKERNTGKEIHFDVVPLDAANRIRFSAWEIYKYAASVGESISEASVASELRRISAGGEFFVHVVDGPFEYYYCPAAQAVAAPSVAAG